MKTINYSDKNFRTGCIVLFLLASLAFIFIVIFDFGAGKNHINAESIWGFMLGTICLIIASIIIGYSLAINYVKNKIVSAITKESISLKTKGSDAIVGAMIIITDGIKLKAVFLKKDTFETDITDGKSGEEQISKASNNYIVLLGEMPEKSVKK